MTDGERLFVARVRSSFLTMLSNMSEPERFRSVMDKFTDDYDARMSLRETKLERLARSRKLNRHKRNP